jgi:putative acetyltransferase
MGIVVRPMRSDEGRSFLDIHARSIRGLASSHYPPEVIEGWAGPARVTDDAAARLIGNADSELRWLAELDGEPVGLGVLVIKNSELRSCYVVPEAARKGVGTALVTEIERTAREHGLTMLQLDSSTNAELFYVALGYEVVERFERVWRSGLRMAAVKMRKMIANAAPP